MSETTKPGNGEPQVADLVPEDRFLPESKRRRVLKGALAVGPVILALKGQSALATTGCASPSRIMSGNLSPGHTAPPCGTGYSPGYWKVCQHLGQWSSAGMTRPTFSVSCTSGMPSGQQNNNTGTTFGQIFSGTGALANFGCWRILAYPSQVDSALSAFDINQIQLARHLIATYINSKIIANFPLSALEIQKMWTDGSTGSYCPSSITCTQPWNIPTLVCYLRNYTMDQTSVSTDPITWSCAGL